MAIYLFIMTFVAILAIALRPDKNDGYKKTFIIICFVLLTVVASVRSQTVGADTNQFWEAYIAIGLTPWGSLGNLRYEWGFLVLCKVLNYVSADPQLFLVVSSCIINIPIGIFVYRNSENAGLSTFLYVALCFYTSNMNIMREAMAVSMALIAFEALKKRHLVGFLLFATLASLFHVTGIICFVFLPLWYTRFDRKTIAFYLLLAALLFIFSSQVTKGLASILGREELYGAEYMGSNYYGALIKAAFAALLIFITLNYYKVGMRVQAELTKASNFYCHMLAIWLVCLVMGIKVEIFSRLCMYFQIFSLVTIPDALYFSQSKNDTVILTVAVSVIATTYFVVIGVFRPEWDGAIPYVISPVIASCFSN